MLLHIYSRPFYYTSICMFGECLTLVIVHVVGMLSVDLPIDKGASVEGAPIGLVVCAKPSCMFVCLKNQQFLQI